MPRRGPVDCERVARSREVSVRLSRRRSRPTLKAVRSNVGTSSPASRSSWSSTSGSVSASAGENRRTARAAVSGSSSSRRSAPSGNRFSDGPASSVTTPRSRSRRSVQIGRAQHAQDVGAGGGAVARRELLGDAGAADDLAPLHDEHPLPGSRQVERGDQAVVPGADHHGVVRLRLAHGRDARESSSDCQQSVVDTLRRVFATVAAMRAIVVGAGAWGLPTAAELVRRGHLVTLVDRYPPGNGLVLLERADPAVAARRPGPGGDQARTARAGGAASGRGPARAPAAHPDGVGVARRRRAPAAHRRRGRVGGRGPHRGPGRLGGRVLPGAPARRSRRPVVPRGRRPAGRGRARRVPPAVRAGRGAYGVRAGRQLGAGGGQRGRGHAGRRRGPARRRRRGVRGSRYAGAAAGHRSPGATASLPRAGRAPGPPRPARLQRPAALPVRRSRRARPRRLRDADAGRGLQDRHRRPAARARAGRPRPHARPRADRGRPRAGPRTGCPVSVARSSTSRCAAGRTRPTAGS